MAITQRVCNSSLVASSYAFKATAGVAVTTIHLCNVTSTDATLNIYLLKSDGSTTVPTENNKLYNTLTIKATDTYIVDTEKLILETGDAIWIETPDSTTEVSV